MKVIKTKHSGYCFGVKRALNITEKILKKNKNKNIKVFTLGSIIHNPGVVIELAREGLISVKNLNEVEPGSVFIIRSHGMPSKSINKLIKNNIIIVDATCPFVKKAHNRALVLSKKDYFVAIIGNKNHPEVIGIKDNVAGGKYSVIENERDAEKLSKKEKIGIVVQTTQTIERLKNITGILLDRTKELLIFNTICSTTKKRQDSTRKISKKADVMIVVGGKNSANTAHLKEISEECNTVTYHIENYKEIKRNWFDGAEVIGVSGGASTPEKDITDVIKAIEEI